MSRVALLSLQRKLIGREALDMMPALTRTRPTQPPMRAEPAIDQECSSKSSCFSLRETSHRWSRLKYLLHGTPSPPIILSCTTAPMSSYHSQVAGRLRSIDGDFLRQSRVAWPEHPACGDGRISSFSFEQPESAVLLNGHREGSTPHRLPESTYEDGNSPITHLSLAHDCTRA